MGISQLVFGYLGICRNVFFLLLWICILILVGWLDGTLLLGIPREYRISKAFPPQGGPNIITI